MCHFPSVKIYLSHFASLFMNSMFLNEIWDTSEVSRLKHYPFLVSCL